MPTRLPKLPRRAPDAHKGHFGRVLVVGGSQGMIGAPALVAQAALRSGAGLVCVAVPAGIQPFVASLCPPATSLALSQSRRGQIEPRAALRALRDAGALDGPARATVLAIGPGLGRGDARFDAALCNLWSVFARAGIPVVLDADALNALPPLAAIQRGAPPFPLDLRRCILTPHPGELARLLGTTAQRIQKGRRAAVAQAMKCLDTAPGAAHHRPVLVLKGAGTLVGDGKRLCQNKTGNPGMATGGSGDVLTGIIAGLLACGLAPYEAAVLGVHLHGKAGDLAARRLGQASLIATDLIDFLPAALRSL